MKIEIYQMGKLPPLTVVECDDWEMEFSFNCPRLRLIRNKKVIAEFFINNIAGFKEMDGAE